MDSATRYAVALARPVIAEAVLATVRLLAVHGGVVEIRIPKTSNGTVSGYFDDHDALVEAVLPWDGRASIYVTPNPVRPDLLARANNRLQLYAKTTTADVDVTSREWFLTDFDPVRPAGISSTDEELQAALTRRNEAVAFLRELGFPEPLQAMSGNGGHAIWSVALPNDDAATRLAAGALKVLKAKFSDNAVHVDDSVFNAARVWKVYGTIAVKGDATPDRPHRRATIEPELEVLSTLDAELLEQLAALAPSGRTYSITGSEIRTRPGALEPIDLVGALHTRGLYLQDLGRGKHAITCPWGREHSGDSGVSETCVFAPQSYGEPWGFDCRHAHCADRTIRDLLAFLQAARGRRASTKVATTTNGAGHADVEALPVIEAALQMAPEAFHGIAGRIVEAIEPYSEADPVAILMHVLVAAGNMIGCGPHALVERTVHACNEFVVLVGDSAKGRKGQAWSTPRHLLSQVDETWASARVKSGLSSGEGLIYHVRDPREEQQPVKERGRIVDYQRVVVDEGETDKRLLIIEPELATVLRRMQGETNSLSAVLREAWETGSLSTLTKSSPLRATGAHVSIIAHTTREELVTSLTETDRANGFANRFMYTAVRRSKCLPEPAEIAEATLAPLVAELRQVAAAAQHHRVVARDPDARELWGAVYPRLSEGEPGLLGAILARAEAHVLRLSVLYAVLDRSPVVRPAHLRAALAVWDHADASARRIFGQLLGLSVADAILAALKERGAMTRDEIRGLFHRNKASGEIEVALRLLLEQGKVRRSTRAPEGGRGRPAEVWEAADSE